MTSILAQPAVQIAALVLAGLFFLNQTRKQGLILSLLAMVAWLGVVVIMVDIVRQKQPDVGSAISKRVIVINETSFVESEPIIETVTEHFVIVLPNEQAQATAEQEIIILPNEEEAVAQVQAQAQVQAVPSASWALLPEAVGRWQPHINQAIAHCGLTTPGYDEALLMAAIVTQESSGNPHAMGAAHDTGLGQVVNNSHPLFPNRPSQAELLDPQFNLNFAACLLRDNLKYTGGVEAAVNAYNGNGIHNGRTYAEIIFSHYHGFQPVANAPVSAGKITNFGSLPVSGKPIITQNFHSGHPGLDIVGSGDILAVMDGVVQYVGPLYRSADGNAKCEKAGCLGGFSIVLNHGGGTFTVYGHNSQSYVQAGEQVKAGQAIARMGSEGRSTGPHVHFELRKNETWNGNINWPWSKAYLRADNPTSYLP